MSGAGTLVAPTPRAAGRGLPLRLSPQVEAQLAKLEELRDRAALALLLQAIEENEGRRK